MRAGQQYGMQPPQQQGKDNIAYNVEHVFKDENGREVGTNHDKVFFISIVFRCERCPWILMAKQYGWNVFPAAAVVNRFVGFGADFQFHLATVFSGWWRWSYRAEHGGSRRDSQGCGEASVSTQTSLCNGRLAIVQYTYLNVRWAGGKLFLVPKIHNSHLH